MDPSPTRLQTKRPRSNSDQELVEQRRAQLSSKILSISREFDIPLDDHHVSKPHTAPDTPEKKCTSLIRFLHFQDPYGLEKSLDDFRSAGPGPRSRTASELAAALKRRSNFASDRNTSPSTSRTGLYTSRAGDLPPPEFKLISESDTLVSTSATPPSSLTLPDRTRSSPSTRASTANTISAQTSFTSVSAMDDDPFVSRPGLCLEDATENQQLVSKSLEHHHVRKFPTNGLFVNALPAPLRRAPEHVRYECLRLSQSYNLDIDQLADLYTDDWKDYQILWSNVSRLMCPNANPTRVAKNAWTAATTESESPYLQRTIRFSFGKKSDPALFHLTLETLQKLPETCRLYRHFGSHRFLKLEIPSTNDLPEYLRGQASNFRSRLEEWTVGPAKEFLGCHWKVFFVRPTKNDKKSKSKKESKHIQYEAFLFAETGPSLPYISTGCMLEWFLPFDRNRNLSLHKAFSRIQLGLSKTCSAFVFTPSQVRWVPDMLADGTLSSNDLWQGKHDPSNPCVMNDGCSKMSIAAAKKIWVELKGSGPCPSAFQARFGPAKGMWMIDVSQGYENPDIWIEVTPSQQKFLPHKEDLNDGSYEHDRLTFEVLGWSGKSTPSKLHRDFLPILEDRGVSRAVLGNLVIQMLQMEAETFFEAFKSDATLYKWIEERFASASEYNYGDSDHHHRTSMATRVGPRVLELLRAGFDRSFEYVTSLVKTLCKSYFRRVCVDFDIPLPKSTYVYGVADPKQCLEPDEIHLALSGQFGSQPWTFLPGLEALVARHPAMKRSDMHRVKVVYKPELGHLRDLVVFSTQGCSPLAAKLQGGDYDGDRFWICFEQSIVQPFQNAAQPCSDIPESFGIQVDRTKLGEIDDALGDPWEKAIRKGIKAILQPQLLGMVSQFHKKLTYCQHSIGSKAAETVVDLHDLIIDSSKNGYSFDNSAWATFKQKLGVNVGAVEKESVAFADISESAMFGNMSPPSTRNIVDHIIFGVARPHTLKILNAIDSLQPDQLQPDDTLSQIYMRARDSGDPVIAQALEELRRGLEQLSQNRKRKRAHDKDSMTPKEHVEILKKATDEAYDTYRALQPRCLPAWWLHKSTTYQPCHWDLVKASAIFALHGECMEFVFDCAGTDLCYIKAHSEERPALVVSAIGSRLKMNRVGKRIADAEVYATGPADGEVFATEPSDGCDTPLVSGGGLDGPCKSEEDEDADSVFWECLESVVQSMERSILESPKKARLDRDTDDESFSGASLERSHA